MSDRLANALPLTTSRVHEGSRQGVSKHQFHLNSYTMRLPLTSFIGKCSLLWTSDARPRLWKPRHRMNPSSMFGLFKGSPDYDAAAANYDRAGDFHIQGFRIDGGLSYGVIQRDRLDKRNCSRKLPRRFRKLPIATGNSTREEIKRILLLGTNLS